MEISISVVFPFSLFHTLTFCAQFVAFIVAINNDWETLTAREEALVNEFVNFVSFFGVVLDLVIIRLLYMV
jgi:hypothetical protein